MTQILPLLYEIFLLSFIICKIFFSEHLNAPIVPLLPSLSPTNVNCYYLPFWYLPKAPFIPHLLLFVFVTYFYVTVILCAEINLTITLHVAIDAECR
jgi:hypothetical protein